MIGTGPQSDDEGDYPGNMPEDRAAFIFEIAAWGADVDQINAALESMTEDDIRRVCTIAAKVYQASRDSLYERLTVGSVRVIPLPKEI